MLVEALLGEGVPGRYLGQGTQAGTEVVGAEVREAGGPPRFVQQRVLVEAFEGGLVQGGPLKMIPRPPSICRSLATRRYGVLDEEDELARFFLSVSEPEWQRIEANPPDTLAELLREARGSQQQGGSPQ